MHVGMSAIFQGFGGTLSDREVWAGGPAPRRSRRAARLRVDLERRAPLHELHDVPRRPAVPHLHGRAHEDREARLDGAGAPVARPGAGGRADRDARPHVQRPADPRPRPGHRQGRVRRLPRRDGQGPPAVQGGGRGDPRRARDRRHGVRRRVRRPARASSCTRRRSSRSRAAPTRPPSRPSRPRSWPSSAPACWSCRRSRGTWCEEETDHLPRHLPRGHRRGAAAADRGRLDLRRRERRPGRGAGPHVAGRLLGLGHRPLRVRQAAPQVDARLRVPRPDVRPPDRARRAWRR